MPNDPARLPRFPYIAALLCAACVGAAAWTWMRYSYCWDVIPHDWPGDASRLHRIRGEVSWPDGALVSLDTAELTWVHETTDPKGHALFSGRSERLVYPVYVLVSGHATPPGKQVVGRAEWLCSPLPGREDGTTHWPIRFTYILCVDTRSRGRLTGQSAAGLVVGAMGVFVFTVALRHWLRERRAYETPAEGAPSGSGARPE